MQTLQKVSVSNSVKTSLTLWDLLVLLVLITPKYWQSVGLVASFISPLLFLQLKLMVLQDSQVHCHWTFLLSLGALVDISWLRLHTRSRCL